MLFRSSVGVDAAGQESVIDKIEAGETLDYATGVDPVRTDTSTLTEDGITYEVVVEHFADGSFSRVKLEQPAAEGAPGQMTPQGIVGCRNTTSGSYQIRTQCKVEWDNPILGLYFYADYRFIPGAHGGGTIDRVYSYNYWGVGGTATGGSLTIPVKTGNPAIATATVIYKSVGSVTGGQQAVSLLVNGSGGSLLV